MAFARPIKLVAKRNQLVLFYGKQVFCKIERDTLTAILADLQQDGLQLLTVEEKKKKKPKKKVRDEKLTGIYLKASQLSKAYAALKKASFRIESSLEVQIGNPKFKHFMGAVEIMEKHNVNNYQTFLQAQVEGMRYLNGGKGLFPKVTQLDTEAAETRLLEYLTATKDDEGKVIKIALTEEDKKTPLSSNLRYLAKRDRVRNGTAKIEEAVYVKECQLQRRGRVDSYVTEFLNALAGS